MLAGSARKRWNCRELTEAEVFSANMVPKW
jgi:hypothetical protein